MYWKEWLYRVLYETARSFRPLGIKLLPAIFTPAFLYLEFSMGGLTDFTAIWKIVICLVESYTLVFAVLFVAKVATVVPIILKERDKVISQKQDKIAQLTTPRVRIQFQRLDFSKHPQWGQVIIVRCRISTGDTPTTLSDFRLCADDGALFNTSAMGEGFNLLPGGGGHLRFEPAHTENGFIQFLGAGNPDQQWYLTFVDHAGREYKEPIPRSIYGLG